MFYAQSENNYIREGAAFELAGVQYPANWLNLSTPEEKAALGLVEVVATNSPENDRYYYVSEELNGATLTYINTPKALDTLKTGCVAQVKTAAYALLQPTDYIDLRNLRDATYKPEWMTWRESVRTTSEAAVSAVTAAATIDELIVAMTIQWPNDPNYVEAQ